jgi:hypothetical protein
MLLRLWRHWGLITLLCLPSLSPAQDDGVDVSANMAPPELPAYDQPPIPGDGYLWSPGYWAWSPDFNSYYWVPGTWVLAPQPGFLWTPGYWATDGGRFFWHGGYWGPTVGFYGGVNYGFGYIGSGFVGGHWEGGHLFYNTAVINVGSAHITNVYEDRTVINNVTVDHESYNGGMGGVQAKPTAAELAAAHEHHLPPTSDQQQQIAAARSNPQLRESENHGKPPIAATPRAGAFQGSGVVAPQRVSVSSSEHAGDAAPAEAAAAAYAERAHSFAPPPERAEPVQRAEVHTAAPATSGHAASAHPASEPMHSAPAAAPRPAPVARQAPEPRPAPAPRPAAEARSAPLPRAAPAPHPGAEHNPP